MSRRARIMNGLRQAAYAAGFMVLGAQILALYLIQTEPVIAEHLRRLSSNLFLALPLLTVIATALDRRRGPVNAHEPSPRQSGVAVVIFTGFAAFVAVGRGSLWYGVSIVGATLILAAAVWRFATAHAGDIGEARFRSDGSLR